MGRTTVLPKLVKEPTVSIAIASRSRVLNGRPAGYLTSTLTRLGEVVPEHVKTLVMDCSAPGETHEELAAFVPPRRMQFAIIPRPTAPVECDEALQIIPASRLKTLPESEVTWGIQITRDFLDLMRIASQAETEFVLRLEDDVYAAEDLIASAIQAIRRSPDRPFVSLFSPRPRFDGQSTEYHCHAQAIIFRNDSGLERLLHHVESLDGQNLFDVLIATFEAVSGHRGIVRYPSLVQHLGTTRSQPGSPVRESLVSPTFRPDANLTTRLRSNLRVALQLVIEGVRRQIGL